MKRSSVEEYADAVRGRYQGASREDKKDILDEFTGVTGYHRKAAIRLINTRPKTRTEHRRGRRRQYGVEVAEGLRVAWEATDRICSKRLKPFLPELMDILQDRGELTVTPQVAQGICQISESTIDRLLGPFRHRGKRRPFSTTKPGSLLKAAIPIRTFGEWDEKRPGFFEVDLVAHCGESTEGLYLNTLSAVDVFTGWVECQGCGVKARNGSVAPYTTSPNASHSLWLAWTPTMVVSSSTITSTSIASVTRSPSHALGPTRKTTTPMWSRRTGQWSEDSSATTDTPPGQL